MTRLLIILFLSLTCIYTTSGQVKILHEMNSFKLTASKKGVSSNGTGFVINRDNNYYLVTAKHLFYPLSVQKDYTKPNFDNSYEDVTILRGNDFSEIVKYPILDSVYNRLLYQTYDINEHQSLDIAVLKIVNPTDELKESAIPFELLETKNDISYSEILYTEGFPTRTKAFHSIASTFASRNIQEMLEKDAEYYYIINIEEDLKGISGGPIFITQENTITKIVGIFVGQNHNLPTLGYGIFSCYIHEIIKNFK